MSSETTSTVPQTASPFEPVDPSAEPSPTEVIQERLQDLREAALHLNERATVFVQERPVVCIVGALALGYVVGRAASRRWLQ